MSGKYLRYCRSELLCYLFVKELFLLCGDVTLGHVFLNDRFGKMVVYLILVIFYCPVAVINVALVAAVLSFAVPIAVKKLTAVFAFLLIIGRTCD